MTEAAPRRGEVWLAELDQLRPIVVLTRDPTGGLHNTVVAAPVTSTIRGLSTEVSVGPEDGVRSPSVANLDNVQLVSHSRLVGRTRPTHPTTMAEICDALATAVGCR